MPNEELRLYLAVSGTRTAIRRGHEPATAAYGAADAHGLAGAEAEILELAEKAEDAFKAWRAQADTIESTNQKGK